MSSKRNIADMDDGEIEEPEQKRSKKLQNAKKHGAKSRQHQNSGIDPTWGQKYVFSGLEDATTIPAGEESDFEDDADAMAYLMSVRQEASGIPHLLVAPKVQIGPQLPPELQGDNGNAPNHDGENRDNGYEDESIDRSIYTNGVGDTRGYYDDGAYVARPPDWYNDSGVEEREASASDSEDGSGSALQDAYHKSLLHRYMRLRKILHSSLPSNTSRLPSSYSTYADAFGPNSTTTYTWTHEILDHDPHPLQLAQLSKDSVLRILRVLLGGKFLRRGHPIPERTSRWLWALLARLPERGELNHVEVGWVRDLGRRAVLLGRSLAEMAALREELEEGGLGVNEAVDESSDDENVLADADIDEGIMEDAESDNEQAVASSPVPALVPTSDHEKKDIAPLAEEGEVKDEEDEDVAMEIASQSSSGPEEGEADEDSAAIHQDLQDAKARLLARLNAEADEEAGEREQEAAQLRSRMNMRATLCMILTVAGEFYGQRDLLEFREPFVGM